MWVSHSPGVVDIQFLSIPLISVKGDNSQGVGGREVKLQREGLFLRTVTALPGADLLSRWELPAPCEFCHNPPAPNTKSYFLGLQLPEAFPRL